MNEWAADSSLCPAITVFFYAFRWKRLSVGGLRRTHLSFPHVKGHCFGLFNVNEMMILKFIHIALVKNRDYEVLYKDKLKIIKQKGRI